MMYAYVYVYVYVYMHACAHTAHCDTHNNYYSHYVYMPCTYTTSDYGHECIGIANSTATRAIKACINCRDQPIMPA